MPADSQSPAQPQAITIRRSRHAQQFVVIPNAIARDNRLSFRARGLITMLLSLPPEWRITTDTLAEDNPDSREAIRKAMRELRAAGYVELHKRQTERGRWQSWLEVYDIPQADRTQAGCVRSDQGKREFPQVAPDAGKPAVGEPAPLLKTEPKNSSKYMGASSSRSGPTQTAAQRQAAAPGYEDKIRDTWQAEMNVYGAVSTDEKDALRLYEHLIGDRRPAYPVRYLVKIMSDAPNIDSLLSNTPPLEDEDDDGGYAEAHGEVPIHTHDVFCGDAECGPACPRCDLRSTGQLEASGLCSFCHAEVQRGN